MRVLDPAPSHPDWPAGVEHRQGDVRERRVVEDAVRGVDVVFHVAGIWDSGKNGDSNMESLNVGGTRTVVEAGAPVVFTSSSITCGYGPFARPRHGELHVARAHHIVRVGDPAARLSDDVLGRELGQAVHAAGATDRRFGIF